MQKFPGAVLLSTSPSFQEFDRPLLRYLSWQVSIGQWEYHQTPDEPSDLEVALILLHDYLQQSDRPIHLIGHGTNGLIGLLYARRYPQRVKSLTLLSVGSHPGLDWQSFYYTHLRLLPCSRQTILTQMVYNLFGCRAKGIAPELLDILDQDLLNSPSPHSLFQNISIPAGKTGVPTFFCGGEDDLIISSHELQGWQEWLGSGDKIWQCPDSKYFFQYFYPQKVAQQILSFWLSLEEKPVRVDNQNPPPISVANRR
jgi:pimeloyl-ACP methyl ester carboxylesterase